MTEVPQHILDDIKRHDADIRRHDQSILAVQANMLTLQNDIREIKAAFQRAAEKMDDQTSLLAEKIDAIAEKALTAWPPAASMLVTVMAMMLAALLTAFFTR